MRLRKGGKETFGWVTVQDRCFVVPQLAWERYGFQPGDKAVFLRGSRTSGGFGLSSRRLLADCAFPGVETRILAEGILGSERLVRIPECIDVSPEGRLLTVFGSCFALVLISRGLIFKEALQHPELELKRR